MTLVKVRLTANYRHETLGAFNAGEGAAFPSSLASDLIARGIAVAVAEPKTLDAPPVHKVITKPPSKKEWNAVKR